MAQGFGSGGVGAKICRPQTSKRSAETVGRPRGPVEQHQAERGSAIKFIVLLYSACGTLYTCTDACICLFNKPPIPNLPRSHIFYLREMENIQEPIQITAHENEAFGPWLSCVFFTRILELISGNGSFCTYSKSLTVRGTATDYEDKGTTVFCFSFNK